MAKQLLKTLKELSECPWLPMDYAGQGKLRRADRAGDDLEAALTIPAGEVWECNTCHCYEGDHIGLSLERLTMLLPEIISALENTSFRGRVQGSVKNAKGLLSRATKTKRLRRRTGKPPLKVIEGFLLPDIQFLEEDPYDV